MSGMDTKGFMNAAKVQSATLDWKDDEQVTVVFHSQKGFNERYICFLPAVTTEKVGKKIKEEIKKSMITSPGLDGQCPFAEFISYLKDTDDIEDDEIVLTFGESGKAISYCKGDILGKKGYDWKKKLALRQEFVFGAIDIGNIEAEVQIAVSQPGLTNAITAMIRKVSKRKGEEEGNPMENPYVVEFNYDKDAASPALMFSCDALFDIAIDDEVQELLDGDGPDLDSYIECDTLDDIWELLEVGLMDVVSEFKPSFLGESKSKKEVKKDKPKKEKKEEPKEEKKEVKKEIKKEIVEEEVTIDKPKRGRRRKVAEPEPEIKEEPKEDVEMSPCDNPKCGKMIPLDAAKCEYCGTEYSFTDEEAPATDEDMWVCKKCETENPSTKSRCSACGKAKGK